MTSDHDTWLEAPYVERWINLVCDQCGQDIGSQRARLEPCTTTDRARCTNCCTCSECDYTHARGAA